MKAKLSEAIHFFYKHPGTVNQNDFLLADEDLAAMFAPEQLTVFTQAAVREIFPIRRCKKTILGRWQV